MPMPPNVRLLDLTHRLLLLNDSPEQIAAALEQVIGPIVTHGLVSPEEGVGKGAIARVLAETGEQIHRQHEVLREIMGVVYRMHPTQERQLLREAELAMQTGIRAQGRDRNEHLKDAVGLLDRVAENPVSGRDYTLRFNRAWLAWQLGAPLAEVEEGFYQAARLAATTAPPFHEYALRHQAHIQYLQTNFEAAVETSERALLQAPDHLDTRCERARYAFCAGRVDEAQQDLEACFFGGVVYLLYAAAEADFADEGGAVSDLIANTIARAQRELGTALVGWQEALRLAREAEKRAQAPIDLTGIDEEAQQDATARLEHIARSSPFEVTALHREVYRNPEVVREATAAALQKAVDARQNEATRLRRQLQKLVDDVELWTSSLEQLEGEARQRGYVLRSDAGLAGLLFMTKKQQIIQQARISYISCLHNLDVAERHYTEQSPGLEKAIHETEARLVKVRAARDWFRAQTAQVAPPKGEG